MQSLMTLLGTARATAEWIRARTASHRLLSHLFTPALGLVELTSFRVLAPVPVPVPRRPARAALFAALLGVIAIAPLAAADDFNNRYSPNSGYQRGGVDY